MALCRGVGLTPIGPGAIATSQRYRAETGKLRIAQRRRETLKGPKPQERRLSWPVRVTENVTRGRASSGPTIPG
jgi:hypothetical protein